MKKFFLTLLILFCFTAMAKAGDYYTVGVNCFNRRMYYSAQQNFEKAIRISPKNVDARYYLAQCYLANHMIEAAQEQYERIILLSPSSNAAKYSQKGLYLIQEAYRTKSSPQKSAPISNEDNYLAYAVSADSGIKRWSKFPINVYVESNTMRNTVISACQQWVNTTGNVKLNYTTNRSNAQIIITFTNNLENTSTKDAFLAGGSKPYYQGNNIIKSDIRILTMDPNTKTQLSNDQIYFSALHEMGHSLGFNAHSPNNADVMYESSAEPKLKLTQRDINTMKMLYKYDRTTLSNIIKNKNGGDNQVNQAIAYTKKFPNKAGGWGNLGDAYKAKKDYPKAIQSYKKAITLDTQNAELHSLLGQIYDLSGNKNGAFFEYKKACDLKKSDISYLYKFAQLCRENNRNAIGINYINNYLKQHPEEKNDTRLMQIKSSL